SPPGTALRATNTAFARTLSNSARWARRAKPLLTLKENGASSIATRFNGTLFCALQWQTGWTRTSIPQRARPKFRKKALTQELFPVTLSALLLVLRAAVVIHDRSQQRQVGGGTNAIAEEMGVSAADPMLGLPGFGDDA